MVTTSETRCSSASDRRRRLSPRESRLSSLRVLVPQSWAGSGQLKGPSQIHSAV